jgi:DNA-binding transcriptional LysR family regulator
MARRVHFDIDALRSFTESMQLGSFRKAADKLARSTSALSAQLRKLEEQAGVPLVRKQGRGLALTEAGEVLLGYARRMLALNDEAALALGGLALQGTVRLGMQEDFGEQVLTDVLGRYARSHPSLRMDVRVARNAELLRQVQAGELDLVLAWDTGNGAPRAERLGALPMQWIGSADAPPPARDGAPVPLVVLDAPCAMRAAATAALDRAGIPWQIVFTSPSLAGVWSAVAAGLGVTVRTRFGMTGRVAAVDGLPPLPELALALHRAEDELPPACQRLHDILRTSLAESLSRFARP